MVPETGLMGSLTIRTLGSKVTKVSVTVTVSYTHLDVYKRQADKRGLTPCLLEPRLALGYVKLNVTKRIA